MFGPHSPAPPHAPHQIPSGSRTGHSHNREVKPLNMLKCFCLLNRTFQGNIVKYNLCIKHFPASSNRDLLDHPNEGHFSTPVKVTFLKPSQKKVTSRRTLWKSKAIFFSNGNFYPPLKSNELIPKGLPDCRRSRFDTWYPRPMIFPRPMISGVFLLTFFSMHARYHTFFSREENFHTPPRWKATKIKSNIISAKRERYLLVFLKRGYYMYNPYTLREGCRKCKLLDPPPVVHCIQHHKNTAIFNPPGSSNGDTAWV